MNFARGVIDTAPADRLALVELSRDGRRKEWSFAEVSERSVAVAATLIGQGVGRGDVVMTVVGNRPEWVLTMIACFRIGAVALPCNEQLRARDIRLRIDAARPAAVVCDIRNLGELERAAPDCPVLEVPDESLFVAPPAQAAELGPEDPCLIAF